MTASFKWYGKSTGAWHAKQGISISTSVCLNVGGDFWELFGD